VPPFQQLDLKNLASQASDVGSIPIARSRSLDDSIALTRLSRCKHPTKWSVLDACWTLPKPIGRYERILLAPRSNGRNLGLGMPRNNAPQRLRFEEKP
jgi:hypothetical protein